tara:strand:- start:16491 stop:17597 length:1107 start_codon:yes stop_codon:yes gene_type:complete
MKNIPFCDYRKLYTENRNDYLNIFDEVASNGGFIMQKALSDFENELAKFIGCKYTIGVANCTDGLEIGWQTIGLRNGDEVICSSHTFIATASSIVMAGGVPVPVDIGPDNLIDPDAVEDAINPRTVGIVPTQLNGRTCDMDRIMDIAYRHKLFVVEDSAQALGSLFKGKHSGTFGNLGAISFYPAKVLGCFGDGGALITNDENIFDKAFQLHEQGRDPNGEIKSWGRNSRLDNIQAAILSFQLKKYPEVINKRRQIAAYYNSRLSCLEELILPPPPCDNGDHFDIFQNYEFIAERRDELKKYLYERGIGTLIQWNGKGIHQWEPLGFNIKLPKVEEFFRKSIMIPIWPYLSDEDIEYIADNIYAFYRK